MLNKEQLAIQAIIDAGEITVGGMETFLQRLRGLKSGAKRKGDSNWGKMMAEKKKAKKLSTSRVD